ncbi:tRNA-dihydrouridine(47) synthase [NAD(P)(+)]-like [Cryptosporidium felis]|nr:tRNA-dihydrouridine(47) synthase [NAD(P)(+)]-like [Cryptosporidium felis]
MEESEPGLAKESSEEYVKKCVQSCEAPIIREFLDFPGPKCQSLTGVGCVEGGESNEEEPRNAENFSKKRNIRGSFKASERSQNLNYIAKLDSNRLCSSFAAFGACCGDLNDGESGTVRKKCDKSHNIEEFLRAKKQECGPDLPEKGCPLYLKYGVCHLGLNCEFGLSHFSESEMANVNGKGEKVTPEMIDRFWKAFEKNNISTKLRAELRGKQAQFPKYQEFFNGYHRLSTAKKERSLAKSRQNPTKTLNNPLLPKSTENQELAETSDPCFQLSESTHLEKKALTPSELAVTKEDMVGICSSEKHLSGHKLFRNKLILAPLTTVGNLPFRRLCLRFGADVTISEMALSNEILAGKSSELALLKRSPEERCFGIQLAGGNKSSLIKAGEFINDHCDFDFLDINAACPLKSLHDKGAGSILLDRVSELDGMIRGLKFVTDGKPITVKVRMSHGGSPISKSPDLGNNYYDNPENWPLIYNSMKTHKILSILCESGIDAITIHGRTSFQRYTKEADWNYIKYCSLLNLKISSNQTVHNLCNSDNVLPEAPFSRPSVIGCGDVICFQDYQDHISKDGVDSVMIGRGALLKPWIFTEIKETRNWDISSNERLDILKQYVNLGLEHWGSDKRGIALTRRFLLEFLSFFHRYIPIGLLEQPIHSQNFNWRVPKYHGRNELETLLASSNSDDWVKISEILLGKVPSGFVFIPKHKANSSI